MCNGVHDEGSQQPGICMEAAEAADGGGGTGKVVLDLHNLSITDRAAPMTGGGASLPGRERTATDVGAENLLGERRCERERTDGLTTLTEEMGSKSFGGKRRERKCKNIAYH